MTPDISAYVGKRVGSKIVGESTRLSAAGSLQWSVTCVDCGYTSFVRAIYLLDPTVIIGCYRCAKTKHKAHGLIGPSGVRMFAALKRGSRHAVTVTLDDLNSQWIAQDGLCALTKLPLDFGSGTKSSSGTASLDRIDSSNGYVVGNIQWVHKDVNIMKNKYDEDYFVSMCLLVARNAREV